MSLEKFLQDNDFDKNSRELHAQVPLRCAVKKDNVHLKKWEEFHSFIKTIQFETGEKRINFPSLKGWRITFSCFQQMIPELLKEIPFVLMNRFNQDALENHF